MEPNNNIDNEFKTILNDRQIEPSPLAWDKLNALLTAADSHTVKAKYNWALVAASLIGFMLINGVVLKLYNGLSINKGVPNAITVVPVPPNAVNNNATKNNNFKEIIASTTAVAKVYINKNNASNKNNQKFLHNATQFNNSNQQAAIKNVPELKAGVSINNQIKIVSNNNQEISNQIVNKQLSTSLQIPTKNANETVAAVTTKQATALLKINPASLLYELEGEFSIEDRKSVFTKISKNLQTLRVVLSDRNNVK